MSEDLPALPRDPAALVRQARAQQGMVGVAALDDVVPALEELAREDRELHQDSVGQQLRIVAALLVVGGSLLGSTKAGWLSDGQAVLAMVVAGVVLLAAESLRYHQVRRGDLPDDFRRTLLPILQDQRSRAPAGTAAHLQLDLSGNRDDKLVEQQSLPSYRMVWEDPWCGVELTLTGGHRLRIEGWTRTLRHYEVERSARSDPFSRQRSPQLVQRKASWARLTLFPVGAIPAELPAPWERSTVEGREALVATFGQEPTRDGGDGWDQPALDGHALAGAVRRLEDRLA